MTIKELKKRIKHMAGDVEVVLYSSEDGLLYPASELKIAQVNMYKTPGNIAYLGNFPQASNHKRIEQNIEAILIV